jgi:hypothetical protein
MLVSKTDKATVSYLFIGIKFSCINHFFVHFAVLKWGDEVEYMIIKFDDEKQTAKVSLRAIEILDELQEKELQDPTGVKSLWRPEYASYMVEGTPGKRK